MRKWFSRQKKDIFIWFKVMFIGLIALHSIGSISAHAALVGYWNFDGPTTATTAQAAVGGADGTLVGGAQFTGTGGIQGGAIKITDGYVDMGDNFPSSPTFSVQAWIKTDPGDTSPMTPVAKHWAGIGQGYYLSVNDVSDGYTQKDLAGFRSIGGPESPTAVGGPAVNDGLWHQLVGVYNNGSTSLYVDANLVGLGGGGYSNNSAHFMVGGLFSYNGTPVNAFHGLIDEVKIWDNALTQADIIQLYQSTGANLVVTSVSGPAKAILNETISVTYTVKNQGTVASGAYQVGLYLSTDKTIDPATDRLLKNVAIAAGLAPGQIKKMSTKVVIPNYHVNGLSGKYYYGSVVATSKKASSKQVSIVRYLLTDNNETVTDHKTDLIWQRADDGQQRNWADANQYCVDLVVGGFDDWRLPRIDELQTIIDFSRFSPAIDPVFSCRTGGTWSGSPGANYPDRAWYVDFVNGYEDWPGKTANYYVRCVRSGP